MHQLQYAMFRCDKCCVLRFLSNSLVIQKIGIVSESFEVRVIK